MFGYTKGQMEEGYKYHDEHCDVALTKMIRSLLPSYSGVEFPTPSDKDAIWVERTITKNDAPQRGSEDYLEKMNAWFKEAGDYPIFEYYTWGGSRTTRGYLVLKPTIHQYSCGMA